MLNKSVARPLALAICAAVVAISLLFTFLLRFEFIVPPGLQQPLFIGLCVFVLTKTGVFYAFGLHRGWWRMVDVFDLFRLSIANLVASTVSGVVAFVLIGPSFPRSIYILDLILCFLLTSVLQFSRRLASEITRSGALGRRKGLKPILIYGAGSAGLLLAKEIRNNPKLGAKLAGFLDDDPGRRGEAIAGVRVLGDGRQAARIAMRFSRLGKPISEVIIAMPSANGRQMRTAIANCRAAGVPFRTVPGIGELLNGKVLTSQLREVSVTDLLGREAVRIEEALIGKEITGKSVLVTGGCGSIGSELCRQLARFKPSKVVMFDQAESDLFMLALELSREFPDLATVQEIGDICNRHRVDEVMSQHRVDFVFHAAAYKHVPMMEVNVLEAAFNNVIGTYNVVQSACEHRVAKFVMISSDKAVNPTSIMGVTKRIAELLVSAMPLDGGTRYTSYVSVRFGNVLGSKGSVVPIFQRQIAAGGPITITHQEMRRYFMSIPESVQLVLQASIMGKGSEIFVLDMGEPVRIADLARNMVRLAGLTPDEDIEFRFTGLRPGEKLFEELKTDTDDVLPTYHSKIKIFRSQNPGGAVLTRWVQELRILLKGRDPVEVKRHLLKLVPEYICESRTASETDVETMATSPGRN